MLAYGAPQLVLYLVVLLGLAYPLGVYIARVYAGEPHLLSRPLGWLETLIDRLIGNRREEMGWREYMVAALAFNLFGLAAVFLLQMLQAWLPLNPEGLPNVSWHSSFNTAVSFATNTNWQGYGGETTMSYLTQMLGLTVQNFVSAASGMAVLVALARGFIRAKTDQIGNFWTDLNRSVVYILMPLSVLLALVLVSQGVVQTLEAYRDVELVQPTVDAEGKALTTQTLALGPAASQVAIKQLGTNGGGFFNVNSSHPFENATPLSNFLECLAILLIPAALCCTFGRMVGDMRQGWALLAAMTVPFVLLVIGAAAAEQQPHPELAKLGIDQTIAADRPGGHMEGKEVRFGVANSALWAVATTAASNGSVNSMHDSYMPLGGLIPMWMMQLGEVIYGGVGSGLYGLILFAVVAVFVAGLMVGRTPEYIGKKIEAFEMKMASIAILLPCAFVLVGTAVAVMAADGRATIYNPGAHGFSEVLYAFSSASNNNGSAFAGLGANTVFYNLMLGFAMLAGRYGVMVPVIALAGSLAGKKITPVTAGTLPTHTPLFIGLLIGTVVIVGALTFIPALALGPAVEHLQLFTQ
jgi:K+-transporting ATPase ATPase A chain